jgi:hypothetical protein
MSESYGGFTTALILEHFGQGSRYRVSRKAQACALDRVVQSGKTRPGLPQSPGAPAARVACDQTRTFITLFAIPNSKHTNKKGKLISCVRPSLKADLCRSTNAPLGLTVDCSFIDRTTPRVCITLYRSSAGGCLVFRQQWFKEILFRSGLKSDNQLRISSSPQSQSGTRHDEQFHQGEAELTVTGSVGAKNPFNADLSRETSRFLQRCDRNARYRPQVCRGFRTWRDSTGCHSFERVFNFLPAVQADLIGAVVQRERP